MRLCGFITRKKQNEEERRKKEERRKEGRKEEGRRKKQEERRKKKRRKGEGIHYCLALWQPFPYMGLGGKKLGYACAGESPLR